MKITKFTAILFTLLIIPNSVFAGGFQASKLGGSTMNPCEIAFVKLLNGKIPAEARGNAALNLWDERFNAEHLVKDIEALPNKSDRTAFLNELTRLFYKDQIYVDNVASVANLMLKKKLIGLEDIKTLFLKKEFSDASFVFSKINKEVSGKLNVDEGKSYFVKNLVEKFELTKNLKKEYQNILIQSNRTTEELEFALKNGMTLRNDAKSLEQLKQYLEFLESSKPKAALNALKDVEKIYNYTYKPSFTTIDALNPTYKKFLAQKSRLQSFETKRVGEIEYQLKLQMDDDLAKEMNQIMNREKMGLTFDKNRKKELKELIDNQKLSKGLQKRALNQAKGERSIYRKLSNGCRSGDSKRLASAKNKFKKFKIALALGGTPLFYWMKNKDKMDKDPFWYERLGYEWGMGLMFTMIGNKIVTNSDTGFWRKYLEGYAKFSALDGVSSLGYDALFGKNSYIRYFQQIYKGKDLSPSEIEKEFEKLKESPTFEEDLKALMAYLEDKSKENNVKNFLDNNLNLGTYSSLESDKITQEDLETEEGREMMMELLAERMYLQNMGNWPIFQTGNTGADRWSFYRMRNIVWDMKGLALNLAIFQIMCREPLGKVGSWGLILGIVLGDQFYSGDLTYGMRRDAINQ